MKQGHVGWLDLTVPDAAGIRDFYAGVTGWSPAEVEMGGYSDFNMCDADGAPVAGICHARGGNSGLPAVWLPYVVVPSLDSSLETARDRGGTVVSGPRSAGEARYAVIRDPAGAHLALYQPATPSPLSR